MKIIDWTGILAVVCLYEEDQSTDLGRRYLGRNFSAESEAQMNGEDNSLNVWLLL
jgi:hypothetical protein